MNTRLWKTILVSNLALLCLVSASRGQDEGAQDGPAPAVKVDSVPKDTVVVQDTDGNVHISTPGIVTSQVVVLPDANGNEKVTVTTGDGVEQKFVRTPQGTIIQGETSFNPAPQNPQRVSPEIDRRVQQLMNDSLKIALGCADDEWAVLAPKIEMIQILMSGLGEKNVVAAGAVGSRNAGSVPSVVVDARAKQEQFQKAVGNKESSDTVVRQALAGLREARIRVRTELVKARKELTDLVTSRQEAILYQRGILAD